MALHIVLNGDESAEVIAFHQAALDAFTGGVVPAPADKPAAASKATGTKGKAAKADEVKEDDVSVEDIRKLSAAFDTDDKIDEAMKTLDDIGCEAISDLEKKKPADRVMVFDTWTKLVDSYKEAPKKKRAL